MRLQHVEELFHEALEQDSAKRMEWLQAHCGSDTALFNEVASLLSHYEPGNFATWPAGVAASIISDEFRIAPSCQLGPYTITEFLAEGGMGIVYRASDPRTGRDVAIKMCKSRWIDRFAREVRAVAALNHPNICTLYDVGPNYLVMEFVEGTSPQGPLPLKTVLHYARQIARALQAAHVKGIIHCDLKPANIKVTPDGSVKILDFGLSRMNAEAQGLECREDRHAEDKTGQIRTGIIGTALYMSPEQATGKPLDRRTDIWAFGVVLYELLVGKSAFSGATSAEVIRAIVHTEPDWSLVPARIRPLLRKCLEKDPSRRLPDLCEFEDLPDVSTPKRVAWISTLALLLLTSAGFALWIERGATGPEPRVTPLTVFAGDENCPSFSPGGKRVVFAFSSEKSNRFHLFVKNLGSASTMQLTKSSSNDLFPAWSPDGSRIAFLKYGKIISLALVPALGGAEQQLIEFNAMRTRPAWTPDSRYLVVSKAYKWKAPASGAGALFLVPLAGSGPKQILTPPPGHWYQDPAISSDGRYLAFASCAGHENCDPAMVRLDRDWSPVGEPKRLAHTVKKFFGLAWTADSSSLIYSAGDIADVAYSYLWRLYVKGGKAPKRLEIASQGAWSPAVSSTGRHLAFTRWMSDADVWRQRLGSSPERILSSSAIDEGAQFSPDGRRLAFVSGRGLNGVGIWTSDANGGDLVQLTGEEDTYHRSPQWSPHGTQICFEAHGKDGHWRIASIGLPGRIIRTLTSGPWNDQWPAWSHDGKWIYFTSDRREHFEVWRIPAQGGAAEQITTNGGFRALEAVDGSSIYYTKNEGDGPLYARRFGKPQEFMVLPHIANQAFVVVENGIFFLDVNDSENYVICFYSFTTHRARTLASAGMWLNAGFSVSPDRKTFLYSMWSHVGSDLMLIDNFH